MQPSLASLWAPQCTQGCPLWTNTTPLLCERKADHYPVAIGGLGLFLICVLRDLSINLGGRKTSSQCSHFSSFVEACCTQGSLSTFPSLKCVFLLFFCFSPPESVLSHLLAAEWNLLHSCFLSQFKNSIVVHLLVQPSFQRKKGNRKEKSVKLTFSYIRVKKNLKAWNQRSLDLKTKLSVLAEINPV